MLHRVAEGRLEMLSGSWLWLGLSLQEALPSLRSVPGLPQAQHGSWMTAVADG